MRDFGMPVQAVTVATFHVFTFHVSSEPQKQEKLNG